MLFSIISLVLGGAPAGTISITVTGLRSDSGYVVCRLFDSENGFPTDASLARQDPAFIIERGKADFAFSPVPPGIYAIACFHENGNGKFDALFGIPLEVRWPRMVREGSSALPHLTVQNSALAARPSS